MRAARSWTLTVGWVAAACLAASAVMHAQGVRFGQNRISISATPRRVPADGESVSRIRVDVRALDEQPVADGTEVMFQEPNYSGSTDAHVINHPWSVSGIDNMTGHDDTHSVESAFQFVDYSDTRWLRFTTWASANEDRPVVALANGGENALYDSASLTFWMKGVPEPASLSLLVLGGLVALRRR